MAKIIREPASAAKETYDLIIVGGGIYGAMLSLEASLRGLRSLLIERDDFGGATSFNSLRIIHGGLRYLQSLDLPRFRESVGERRWFLRTFPRFVKPLPCLMPLYGKGLCRPSILRVALCANDLLSCKRNQGVRPNRQLPPGKIIDANQTREIFPFVDVQGLKGGAVWYDASMPDSQRLLIDVLRWACELGATALNYVEARQLLKKKEGVVGVIAADRENGAAYEYMSNVVVNTAGPWCGHVAASFHQDEPTLFKPSIAWNVLLKKKALSDHALAVTPKKLGGHTYFLVPWKGKLFAGTGHAPWLKGVANRPIPTANQLHEFLNDLNLAIPRLGVSPNDILRIFVGFLPATEVGTSTLAIREVIIDHSRYGGPQGLYCISGVKFTTSRLVAEKTLNRIFSNNEHKYYVRRMAVTPPDDLQKERGIFVSHWRSPEEDASLQENLRTIIAEESVLHLDDLILRRTTLGDNPTKSIEIAPFVCQLFDWDETRRHKEIRRLKKLIVDKTAENKSLSN